MVLLSIAGCAEIASDGEIHEQDPETAQMIAAARAVTDGLPMDAITIMGSSATLDEHRGKMENALGVARAACELEACVANDVAVVRLSFVRVVQTGDDQARVSVTRSVPHVDRGGDVEWSQKVYDVRLQRDREGWTVTAARVILES